MDEDLKIKISNFIMGHIDLVPKGVLFMIADELDGKSFIKFCQTNKKMRKICYGDDKNPGLWDNEEFWARKLEREYGEFLEQIPDELSYKIYYLSLLRGIIIFKAKVDYYEEKENGSYLGEFEESRIVKFKDVEAQVKQFSRVSYDLISILTGYTYGNNDWYEPWNIDFKEMENYLNNNELEINFIVETNFNDGKLYTVFPEDVDYGNNHIDSDYDEHYGGKSSSPSEDY